MTTSIAYTNTRNMRLGGLIYRTVNGGDLALLCNLELRDSISIAEDLCDSLAVFYLGLLARLAVAAITKETFLFAWVDIRLAFRD